MQNINHKFSKEIGYTSIKVQELIKNFPDEKFENTTKEQIYKEAKYCHKAQNGIIRISKYVFNNIKNIKKQCLSKQTLEISTIDTGYDYGLAFTRDPSIDSKIWPVNFASETAFSEWGSDSYSQEAAMIMEMPLLHKASLFLYNNIQPNLRFRNEDNIWFPSPILFEGIPQWLSIYTNKKQTITWDKKNNIISMMSPFGGDDYYTITEIFYLFTTLFAGFGGIIKRGKKDKINKTEVHTGNWGCGNMRNNKELIYLAQIYVASVLGIDKIVFHCVDTTLMENAIQKWHSIPNDISISDAIKIFLDFGFKWRE